LSRGAKTGWVKPSLPFLGVLLVGAASISSAKADEEEYLILTSQPSP